MLFSVIPAKAGIQSFQIVINSLDSGFHRVTTFYETIKVDFFMKPPSVIFSQQVPFDFIEFMVNGQLSIFNDHC